MFPSLPLVLAVDGGQSSTLAVAATFSGRILGSGLAGPSNHVHEPGGLVRLETALLQSTTTALQQAHGTPDQVTHICLGMTGAADEARAIVCRLFPKSVCEAYVDMVTALAGASLVRPGVVVIAGTGSIAYGRLENGRDARAGGWGYLIGDEGSAYQIGRAALQSASHAVDRRAQPTLLVEKIAAYFGVASFQVVRDVIYTSAIQRPQLAALATVVTEAASQGDPIAVALLDQAGRDLAATALAVMRQLDTLETGMTVYTTGGVFQAGGFVLDSFQATIRARSSGSRVQEAIFSPVIGALLLALQAAGCSLAGQRIDAIRASLPRAAIEKHREREG